MGGQTALNVAMKLAQDGVLEEYGVELIGANARAIQLAEDRQAFAEAMREIGLAMPTGAIATSLDEAESLLEHVGFPAIIRPSFTLGGTGGGIAYNRDEFESIVRRGLALSPTHQVLIEQSVLGWKEFELEVMRDHDDNVVIVCSIENLDPMGIHTGDSITVAPAMTLTDREYQRMRDAAIAVIREDRCRCRRLQHPVRRQSARRDDARDRDESARVALVRAGIESHRVSDRPDRHQAGGRLPTRRDPRTTSRKTTPASFEPVLDYVVVKVPRFAFEKFAGADPRLTTQMKSVGESMAIGRTFKEALQKGLRALEAGRSRVDDRHHGRRRSRDRRQSGGAADRAAAPRPRSGSSSSSGPCWPAFRSQDLHEITGVDHWFLSEMEELVEAERWYSALPAAEASGATALRTMKRMGFSDQQLALLRGETETPRARVAACRPGAPRIQDGRYLRGRVPVVDALPLWQLRRGERSAA